jgi:Tol biopolymer transport system component
LRRIFLLVATVAAGVLAASASGSQRAATIRLAYAGETPVPAGIYRVDPGAKAARLSKSRQDAFPTWSADAKSIAFDQAVKPGSPNTNCRIAVVPATGGAIHAIAGVTAACRSFSWFRTGWIAFNDPKNAVWIVKPDGTGLRKLMRASGSSTLNPACSPDGKLIAFGNAVFGGITVVGANGSGLHAITKPAIGSGDGYPAWSPNGKEIAFVRSNPDFTWSVIVVRSDGTGLKKLVKTQTQPDFVRPAWTADGSSIVYGDVNGISIVPASGWRKPDARRRPLPRAARGRAQVTARPAGSCPTLQHCVARVRAARIGSGTALPGRGGERAAEPL